MRPAIFTAAVIAAGVSALSAWAADTRPSFHGLGDLPGGEFGSRASAISADGTTVIGSSVYAEEPGSGGIPPVSRYGPFRWSETEGMVPLDPLSGMDYDYNYARALSGDGSVIAGHATTPPSLWPLTDPLPRQAFRWTEGTGAVGLGYFEGSTWESSRATGVSADGSVVVGGSYGASNFEAFRWTESGGMEALGVLAGSDSTEATAVSANASVVVGRAFNQDEVLEQTAFSVQAFRWTQSGGMEGLGFLDGLTASQATAVSADGSAVVGVAHKARSDPFMWPQESIGVAFRWTESDGMVPLEVYWEDTPDGRVIVGGGLSRAQGVSGDGSIIVGATRFGDEFTDPAEAFIWTEADGMRSLQDFLVAECGLDLTGWTLTDASGISADGLTIVGTGINPDGFDEAWIATVPEPAALLLLAACWAMLLRRRRSA
jgi:probable HAF family extracellular repeat protein